MLTNLNENSDNIAEGILNQSV